jgi:bifunctional UDP-N-acetylglucosamine pyrophosphorylase/glucosamine-1-phosphate N-acetyltransferase
MAAGQGKRMQDPTKAKVLYDLAGTPLVGHVLNLCSRLGIERTVVIIGFGRDQVKAYLGSSFPSVETAIQEQQLGTGHAVQQAAGNLQDFNGDVLVLSGDVPLLSVETVHDLLKTHRESKALATVLAVEMPDPTGYGRIVKAEDGKSLAKIVEEKDASEEIRTIKEINSGIYLFDSSTLFSLLGQLGNNNAQGEYYLTDIFSLIVSQYGSERVAVAITKDPIEVSGVNTKAQLQELEQSYLERTAKA